MTERQSSRLRILHVAAKILDQHGEPQLRISEVCKKAKVTAPSIYHFFDIREGLIDAHAGGRRLFGDGAARGPHEVVPHPVGKDAGAVAPTREIRQV